MKYLIIGQGLAGTLIGYRLERAGAQVHYLDDPEQRAASAVAAGIVNPITGRRFVKSWRIDELLPVAQSLYAELEDHLGIQIWHDLPLLRTLFNRGDQNDWLARSGDPGYAEYMDDDPATGRLPELTAPVFAYAGVRHAARVDISILVNRFRKKLEEENRITSAPIDYPALTSGPDGVSYPLDGSLRTFDRVIFCEGWRARNNPWFSYLPHGGNKGEVLIVKTEDPPLELLFKHRIFLVPRADGTYWVGATSENRFDDDSPTPLARNYLEDRLREVLTVPFEIIDQQAAVRPTVRDRRMLIGPHPTDPRLWIFNGLGTKGASLAPLGSTWLLAALLEGERLPGEVDVGRYSG